MEISEVEKEIKDLIDKKESVNREELINFTQYLLSFHVKLNDKALIDSFCAFLFEYLKGNSLPQKFKEEYDSSYKRKRKIVFVNDPIIYSGNFQIHSFEGKTQFKREEKTGKILCFDSKKSFMPKESLMHLKHNKTHALNLGVLDCLKYNEPDNNNDLQTKIFEFDINDIIKTPMLLDFNNKDAKTE
ncbi:hypothetical protein EHP00_436 [Ecytonucleospora hepatopenaei]|uniref:Uncharacterized protein n=1 Tax=Ecytonucleospora hepatopenaei TaxID=646526 RepID=A0A1W0E929_9MICR|nr:hypothetical protein EHP00_436 [Ecytonucleospora hepatopenaei]